MHITLFENAEYLVMMHLSIVLRDFRHAENSTGNSAGGVINKPESGRYLSNNSSNSRVRILGVNLDVHCIFGPFT